MLQESGLRHLLDLHVYVNMTFFFKITIYRENNPCVPVFWRETIGQLYFNERFPGVHCTGGPVGFTDGLISLFLKKSAYPLGNRSTIRRSSIR